MSGAEMLDQLVGVSGAVWRASWQGSVVAALVLAVQLICGKRISAGWRHAMWMLVLVRLALPVVPSSPMSMFNLTRAESLPAVVAAVARPAPTAMVGTSVATAAEASSNRVDIANAPPAASRNATAAFARPQIVPAQSPSRGLWTGWPQALATLWAAGVIALALRIGWATWRVSRTLRTLDPVADPAVHDVLRATAMELGVGRLPQVLAGEGLFSPALVGCVRPRLLVPRDLLASFDRAELRLIFLHELAHLKRRDVAVNWAATVLTVAHWPNPVAWLVVWRLRLERELACDELVMSRTSDTDRRAYGHTIVKLLETFSRGADARPPIVGGVGILEGKSQMKRRITMIAHFAKSSRKWTAVAACLILMLGLVALTDAVQAEAPAQPATRPAPGLPTIGWINEAVLIERPTDEEIAEVDPTMHAHLMQLRALEGEREQAGRSVGEHHPRVVEKDAQIQRAKDLVRTYGAERRKALAQPTKLKVGDLVSVSIMDVAGQGLETRKTARIDGDGTINLPYVGAVKAGGLSPVELEKAVARALLDAKLVENAVVAVSMPGRGESHQLAQRPAPRAVPGGFLDPAMMDPSMMGIEQPMMEDPGMVRGMAAPPAPMDEAMKNTLARPLPEVKLDAVPLADVIDFLRDTTGANLFVNWRALEAAGIDRGTPVSLNVRGVAFADVLALVLKEVGPDLTYHVKNSVITIDAPHQPAKPSKNVTRAYDVADLLNSQHVPGGLGDQGVNAMEMLTRTIYETVSPDSWRSNGGAGGISTFGGKLIVTAVEEVHGEITNLLDMLRDKPTTNPAAHAADAHVAPH